MGREGHRSRNRACDDRPQRSTWWHTVDFRGLASGGITLLGSARSYRDGVMQFAPDLARNFAQGDADYLSVLDRADAYCVANRLELPEEPAARELGPDSTCVTHPLSELKFDHAGIRSIIWATGYAVDFDWLRVDALDERGRPLHER